MATFEEKIEKACEDLEIPGAILVAESADGIFSSPSPREAQKLMFARQISI
jgi:hypothetical protein